MSFLLRIGSARLTPSMGVVAPAADDSEVRFFSGDFKGQRPCLVLLRLHPWNDRMFEND